MDVGRTPAKVARALHEILITEQQRIWRRAFSVPRIVELASKTQVGTTAHDVVLERGSHRLVRYRRDSPATYAEPVLFCYALINRPYILDLQPDKSVVRRYLERGFDVYMIDWGTPSDADRGLTLEDYVLGFLKDSVELVRGRHDRDSVHLLGYCMGGTMSALFTALHPDLIRSLTLLAAPIDFGGREALLNLWADRELFDVDAFVDAHGNCPAWFLQTCFSCMNPVQSLLGKGIAFYDQMDDPGFVANNFAMERWINDNIPVAGETFREFVKKLYQDNQLVRGEFHLGERRVDLRCITCPLLVLTAKNDHLVAPSSTERIRDRVGSRDIELMSIDAGHVGLVVGGKAQKTFWPKATGWLGERSESTAEHAVKPDF
jgi:polyhydroxyalkanoate synthase subunit PhaC